MSLSNEEVAQLVDQLGSDAKAIKKDLLTLCWFMRGSISFDDAMSLSLEDRTIVNGIINDNLETTKESGLPFF